MRRSPHAGNCVFTPSVTHLTFPAFLVPLPYVVPYRAVSMKEAAVSAERPQQTLDPAGDAEDRMVAMHSDPRFLDLKRRLTGFVFPASIAFLAWYLLYVVMSVYARGVMSTVLFGDVNVALVFGVLQFVTTFGIAILYSRYANRRLDPVADELRAELTGAPAHDELRGGRA